MAKRRIRRANSVPIELNQKGAIYVRVSTHWQVDKDSLPIQREELVNYCKYALNIENYDIFEDAGYSAKNTERPAYQQMMARLRTGEFSHLVVWKIDRISRNLIDFAMMYDEIKRLGVAFVSKNEQFDTSSAMGEAMLKIILVFAELERKVTSERVMAIMLSRAANGYWNGGRVPLGYSYDKETNTFSIVPHEAELVHMIYDRYEIERSLVAVAKYIDAKGLKSRRGHEWTPTTINSILRSPFYVGTYRYNYRDEAKTGNSNGDFKPESEWIMVEDHHVPIIDPAQWNNVNDILYSNRRIEGGGLAYNRKNIHIFAGLLTCGNCGSKMAAQPSKVRASGWRPSMYSCYRRRQSSQCTNKYVSEVTLGPFALNYIANMIKAFNSFGKTTDIETLEKKLLRGKALAEVEHIEGAGLQEFYDALRFTKFPDIPYQKKERTKDEEASEIDLLLNEKRRNERALTRLQNLYLYGENSIAEKDYLSERKRIIDDLEKLDARLDLLEKNRVSQVTISDGSFIESASYFLLQQSLIGQRDVNYENYVREIDPRILKDFFLQIIQNFCISDGKIESIRFRNGVTHRFLYKGED